MKDKRYLLFTYPDYYPAGGLGDKKGSYDTIEEAVEAASKSQTNYEDYVDIYDRIEGVAIDTKVYDTLRRKPFK